ncbi:MAG: SpoIIE family protein phosphatase [bacterium]
MIRKSILLAFLIIPLVSYAQVDSTDNIITFRVFSKPTPYAAKIHITGNHPQFRNWASPGIPLDERSDGVWEKSFSFKKGTQLEYDLNLGSFESIGLDSFRNILGDSIFHAGRINQHSHSFLEVKTDTTVTAQIPQWREGEIHLFADNLDTTSIWLDVLWKYHPGDSEEWANPDFDDSSWELVRPALRPNELPKNGWQGVGWFRLHIVLDSTFIKPLALSIRQAGASQLYLDGTLIYTFGEHSDDWTGVPKVITFDGKKRHVIAVRYSNLSVNKFHRAGFNAGFHLQLGNVNQMAEDRIHRERTLIGYQMFFTSLPLAISLLHLILFAFFPSLRQNLFFALFLFSYAAAIFFDYQASLSTDIGQNLFFLRMHRAVNTLFVLFQLRFVYSLFYRALPKQFWIISLVAFILGVLAIYKPVENFGLFGIVGGVIFIETSRVILLALFKKREGAWIIGLAFFVFYFFGTFDALMDAGIIVPFREMQNPYAFGSIGFFIAMSVYLSRDFARANKKVAEQEMEQKLLEAENARQSKELEEARKLQLSMLPKCIDEIPGLDICFHMQTATEVGGDYYDYRLADDGTLTIAIGDATGHGMKAGTMVSVMKGLFLAEASQTDILAFFKKCTQTIKQMQLGNLYMAMMLVKIKDHKMTASSAGIPPIYIYRSETKSVEEIVIKGMPLGGPASFSYKKRETNLAPGDTVLLMSDGFPELFNDKDEMLDYPRVKEIFKEAADRSADEIVAHLFKAGEKWSNGRPQDDDITFVVLKVKHNRNLE